MNHPSRIVACPLRFSPCETGRLSIEARNSFEGPVTKRRQFVSENAYLSRVLMLLHQSLGIVSCDPCDPTKIYWRIMDHDQWFLAVSLQTNDRIHSRVETFLRQKENSGSLNGFLVLPVPIVTILAGTIIPNYIPFIFCNSRKFFLCFKQYEKTIGTYL